jgi:hypothetical protein
MYNLKHNYMEEINQSTNQLINQLINQLNNQSIIYVHHVNVRISV